ncbi:DUF5949 family protein [Streptomyces sp. NPDC093546]|uniref:DUF5949 family protein n=1 Tax=Streptomyces sp. NPDC093546 TaxID=3366040 RepID=UPI0037F15777
MTSSTVESPGWQRSLLGTLAVIAWTGDPTAESETPRTPFLMVYSLGDGAEGPEAGGEAMRAELEKLDLSIGDRLTDLGRAPQIPVSVLVEAQRAVLELPFMKVQCPVPPEWEKDAHESGTVYLIIATRPWPDAVGGKEVSPDRLRAFVSDEGLLQSSAHCLLPVRRVRV